MKNVDLFALPGLVAIFLGLFLVAYAAAAAPTPTLTRTGVRGLKRQKALASGGSWAQIEPLVRWGGKRIGGLLSPQLRASLDRQVVMAGGTLGLLAEELVFLSVLGGVVGVAVGALAAPYAKLGPLGAVGIAAFGVVAPFMWISGEASERATAISRRLPSAIDLLALVMAAGLDFPGALKQAIEKSGTPDDPIIEELALTLQSLQFGRTRRQALEELAERAPIAPVREFVGAVVQAELRGNPLADVLRIQAEVARQQRTVRAEEAAAKAAVGMIGPLVLVFVAIMILIVGPIAIKLKNSGL